MAQRISGQDEELRRSFPSTAARIRHGRRCIARAWGVVYLNDDGTVETDPLPQLEPDPEP